MEKLENTLHKFYMDYQNSMKQQSNNARMYARFSPMALFQYAAEDIAGTGMKQQENFISDIKAFSPVFDSYVLRKVGELVGGRKFRRGWHVNFQGKSIRIYSPKPEQYEGDMSDFPIFHESKPSLTRTLRDAMLDLSGLLLWNIVLALGAFIAFNYADVR